MSANQRLLAGVNSIATANRPSSVDPSTCGCIRPYDNIAGSAIRTAHSLAIAMIVTIHRAKRTADSHTIAIGISAIDSHALCQTITQSGDQSIAGISFCR